MVITFKVLTPSRQDPFSRPCLGAHFFMFVAAFSGKVTILSPNLDPKARVLHVTFRLFFRPGTKRGPRGDQEVPKTPKGEPRKCPGYPKRVLGDLFRVRWRGGRRQLDIYIYIYIYIYIEYIVRETEEESERDGWREKERKTE